MESQIELLTTVGWLAKARLKSSVQLAYLGMPLYIWQNIILLLLLVLLLESTWAWIIYRSSDPTILLNS
jgi:hypothetical protein